MSWASAAIETLKRGEYATFVAYGTSMQPKIMSGSRVRCRPVSTDPEVGDIVLCTVSGRDYLHLVKAKRTIRSLKTGRLVTEFQIGNNRGGLNGWCTRKDIFGVFVSAVAP